jgi:hypothetical protein
MNSKTIIAFALVTSALYACSDTKAYQLAEPVLEHSTKHGYEVNVVIAPTPKQFVHRSSFDWGADKDHPPARIIVSIHLTHNGRSISVPLSAYSDLGNPDSVLLQDGRNNGIRLMIQGGESSGSYHAVLEFRNDEIKWRRVNCVPFSSESWEETFFHFNHLKN